MPGIRRLRVSGRVQGVGFRWFTREAARRLGVGGWVRNESDGSVVLVASGTDEQLDRLECEVRGGPPGAAVTQVDVCMLSDDVLTASGTEFGAANARSLAFQVVRS